MPDDRQPLAFSPGSITCFFYVERGATPQTTVSRGCAINIAEGVTAAICESNANGLTLNGAAINLPTVDRIVRQLAPHPVTVHLRTPLAIGCGFGVSAASALAAAFAIDHYFELGCSREDLGMMAHVAEVECGTGVGDVAAQLCGGVVYRRCRQSPFDCQRLNVDTCPLMYVVFGSLSTREILKSEEAVRTIGHEGRQACRWLEAEAVLTLPAILRRSRRFATGTGLITAEVQAAIDAAAGYDQEATMILLGQSVVAVGRRVPDDAWTCTTIDEQGTRILA